MECDSFLFVPGVLRWSLAIPALEVSLTVGCPKYLCAFGWHFTSFIFSFWKIIYILCLSKNIIGTNGRTLIKYSRLCKIILCTESVEGKNGADLVLRNAVIVKPFIPVLPIKIRKSTRELHSTFQLWDISKSSSIFPTVEEEYQRLGNEIPRKYWAGFQEKKANE